MIPTQLSSDPLTSPVVHILFEHRLLQIAIWAVTILILVARQVSRSRLGFIEVSRRKRIFKEAFPRVLQFSRRLLFGLLACAGSVAVILLIGVALNACGSRCSDALDTLANDCTRPAGQTLSLVAIVVGGLLSASAERESLRKIGVVILGVGMVVAAPNFLSFYTN